jgi:hypothetical protein
MKVLELRRIQTPKFYVDLSKNNIFGAEPGKTLAASDGIWAHLEPVSNAKEHMFEFHGENQMNFGNNAKYNLHRIQV